MQWFAVVSRDGSPRRAYKRRSVAVLYKTEAMARRYADRDGDAVVVVDIDLTKEPIFIRKTAL
jgi:hypothetical protein